MQTWELTCGQWDEGSEAEMNWENGIDVFTLWFETDSCNIGKQLYSIKKKLQKKKKEWVGEISSISELDSNLPVASFLVYFLYIFIYFYLTFPPQ